MKLSKIAVTLSGVMLSGLVLSNPSFAKGRLVIYCSAQNTMCEQEAMAFEKKFDVKTSFIRGGTGTILAKIDAEKTIHKVMFGMVERWILILKRGKWGY